jgi:tRNA-specific 2-thiouridylase
LLSFDLQQEYQEQIIDYIFASYEKGITPNPDVLCNSLIKFDVFLKKALELGFDKIATGHYARIQGNQLLRGIDHHKDQSYFLAGLNQFQLSHSLFPL